MITNDEERLRQSLTFTESTIPERISADPEVVENGLARLVLSIIELIRRLLEKQALRSFGLYMQYMDDLEDYYEDKLEGRRSPIRNPWSGMWRTSRLLAIARRDLRGYYAALSLRRYRIFMTWVAVYHLGIVIACVTREATRHLPRAAFFFIDRFTGRLAKRNPFFYVAPVGSTYAPVPPERTASR